MTSLAQSLNTSSLKRRVAMAAAAAGLAGSLLLTGSSVAKADGPYTGYFTVSPGQQYQQNWNQNPSWNWNQNQYQNQWWNQRNDHDWDDDFWNSKGWWDRDGMWRSNNWLGNSPVYYTYNKPQWDPHRKCWVIYHNNRPVSYTYQQPMYRPATNVYVVVSVSFNNNAYAHNWGY
jgi:hypothetical protein